MIGKVPEEAGVEFYNRPGFRTAEVHEYVLGWFRMTDHTKVNGWRDMGLHFAPPVKFGIHVGFTWKFTDFFRRNVK